ncbi:MAG: DUF6320 domain-containing protein [Clostridia bacterium]
MSYCVNCGVELEKSERRCPLCGVEVINPVNPINEEDIEQFRPYPVHVERLNARVDRRYTATFISLMLLIPVFITMFTNLLINGRFSWSLYVTGSLLVVFTCLLLPLMLKKRNAVICLLLDGAAIALFLKFIELQTDTNWFLHLGLPIVVFATLYALLIAWLSLRKNRMDVLIKCAVSLSGAGVFVVLIECSIHFYERTHAWPHWSVYALFPCHIISAGLLLLNRRANVKSQLKRRFFV